MATILSTHEPFLQSKAQVFILPVSTDGNLLHPIVARCKTMFADNYDHYHKKALVGELLLGDVLLHKIQKQHTGLGTHVGGADYIANLAVQKFPEHAITERMLTQCLKALKPKLYDLMRYHGVRRVAVVASAFLIATPNNTINAQQIFCAWENIFGDTPKLTIELHFGKETDLSKISQKTLETSAILQ